MLNLRAWRPRHDSHEPGQVLVIFALAFVAIIMMLALLFDGGRALVLRRELKNASDAAAMAAANLLQTAPKGCASGGAPRADVVDAAKASVAANMPGYDLSQVVVTCPGGLWGNFGVSVQLGQNSPTFFGTIFNQGPISVSADSTAVNGQTRENEFSVVILNPYHADWHSSTRGCPSFLISGGPTITFESTLFVDSACLLTGGGAFSTNGNSATLTFVSKPPDDPLAMRIVGEYKPQALTVTPTPLEHQDYKKDPFETIPEPPTDLLLQRDTNLVVGTGSTSKTKVLLPGVYKGGINVRNQSVVYLKPGIYVMDGGNFSLGAQTKAFAVPNVFNEASFVESQWDATCIPDTTVKCGVLIYNKGTASGADKLGQINVAAGATFKVRSYQASLDTTPQAAGYTPDPQYDHFLIWQSRSPAPNSNTYQQPPLLLSGGGNVFMAGTVYAPSAKVLMGGTSGGSGGGATDLTLQFISWELELSGNSSFTFRYNADEFPTPADYGLVE